MLTLCNTSSATDLTTTGHRHFQHHLETTATAPTCAAKRHYNPSYGKNLLVIQQFLQVEDRIFACRVSD